MRTQVNRIALTLALLGLITPASVRADPVKAEARTIDGKVLLTFTAEVRPTDPFHDANAVGASAASIKGFQRGDTFYVVIRGTLTPGYHTYPLTRRSEDQLEPALSTLKYPNNPGLVPLFPVEESEAKFVDTKIQGIWLEFDQSFTWTQEVFIQPDAKPGTTAFNVTARTQICDDKGCTWLDTPISVPVTILDEPAMVPSPAVQKRLEMKTPPAPAVLPVPATPVPAAPDGSEPTPSELGQAGFDTSGLVSFVLQGMFWGLVSLITPCVFPMIPITVSFFLKQSESNKHSALKLATVYTLTVVIVLTIAAVALLSVFRWLSVHWVMNAFIGGLFIFFALSLFGMYDIEVPSILVAVAAALGVSLVYRLATQDWGAPWSERGPALLLNVGLAIGAVALAWLYRSGYLSQLADVTSSRESQGGIVGTIFMALTFTIISFACVAPFLGGFGGTAASSGMTVWHRLAGGFAFAATFAAPFFLLALFPSMLKSLPKSGSWMNSVKVVMGFLEVAAALKFFRQAEVAFHTPIFFTYDFVMATYVALCLLCGLYLIGVYNLHHDKAVKDISVSGLILAFLFFGLGFYLMPAMFKTYNARGERTFPSGVVFAWIDSFMLPDTSVEPPPLQLASPGGVAAHREVWLANLRKGLAEAKETGKNVFVDFTGVTCTNCKINERSVFPKPAVRNLFEKYVLVQLYTDRIPETFYSAGDQPGNASNSGVDAQKNLAFQREVFNTEQLPLYVVLRPVPAPGAEGAGAFQGAEWLPERGFQEIGRYFEGKINDEAAFIAFLEKFAKK